MGVTREKIWGKPEGGVKRNSISLTILQPPPNTLTPASTNAQCASTRSLLGPKLGAASRRKTSFRITALLSSMVGGRSVSCGCTMAGCAGSFPSADIFAGGCTVGLS